MTIMKKAQADMSWNEGFPEGQQALMYDSAELLAALFFRPKI